MKLGPYERSRLYKTLMALREDDPTRWEFPLDQVFIIADVAYSTAYLNDFLNQLRSWGWVITYVNMGNGLLSISKEGDEVPYDPQDSWKPDLSRYSRPKFPLPFNAKGRDPLKEKK